MSNIWKYTIAGFPIEICGGLGNSPLSMISGFRIFETPSFAGLPVLSYDTSGKLENMSWAVRAAAEGKALHQFDFEEIDCCFYSNQGEYAFRMTPPEGKEHFFYIENPFPGGSGCVKVMSNWEENPSPTLLRFSLWMAFGIAIAPHKAFAIHSSVIAYRQKAYLFLGESGTGKSTHTRLWRENIPDCFLLNDDSPIMRVIDGVTYAYGSPWSGKTPCYRDENYPVGAVVRLSQAPYNKINRLNKITSFGALYPSCPPAFAYDDALSDLICDTLSSIVGSVPVFHLECLPDADAVRESQNAIVNP